MAVRPSGFRARRDGPLLAVSGLGKSYRRRPVLREVSLNVHAGELVAVTGENGAGKTTLLRICAGLAKPLGEQPPVHRPQHPGPGDAQGGEAGEPGSARVGDRGHGPRLG